MAAVAFGLFTAAAASIAPASADGGNDAFLNALNGAGVQYGDPNATAALGQAICPILAQPGGNFAQAASTVTGGSGIAPGMTGLFTTLAIQMYCPTMISQMAGGNFSGIGNLAGLGNFAGVPQIPGLPGF
ncbi:MAG TPA: DUF732 domain-containing protein [Mycobacterium sp.]|nr:DUF732 domain-containing protein [Mycobacterium sp.]